MEFKFIDTIIDNIVIDLEVLEKDTNNYTMLLFQHRGVFSVSDDKFGNETDCSVKFTAFIELIKTKNVSLALTPEYSCPWNSIEQIVGNQARWPNKLKLWALCCESITPDEIKTFRQNYANDNVLIYFDEEALNHGGGVLLDPMVYIFKAHVDQVEKLIIVVQFKTQHMGVWETPLERDKYIWGSEVYVLRNAANSVYLFTNICSEAATFSITNALQEQLDYRWDEQPYMILNPQMNPEPTHEYFRNFRKAILQYHHKDIISLNWGGNTMLSGRNQPLIPLSKSSIVFKTTEVDYDDLERISRNHQRGLYYLNKKANNHAYYLAPSEEVFLITNQKPASSGIPGAFSRRTGPEVLKVYQWNNEDLVFNEINQVDDGFIDFLTKQNCNNSIFRNIQVSFIDKERLVNISCGKASAKKGDKRWFTLDKLETFVQDENEVAQRLTYVHDERSEEMRIKYIDFIDCLNEVIIPDDTLYPENLTAFKGKCKVIMFFYNDGYNYNYNLVTNDGHHRATVAYIGRNSEGTAQKSLRQLQDIFEKEDQSKKRVVVWYKENVTDIKPKCEDLPPSVSDDSSVDPNSITKV